jgi:dienelactone hydrolase
MDIGTFDFNYVRTLMVAGTGAADLGECMLVGQRIRQGDTESWVREWVAMADKVRQIANEALNAGQTVTAKQAFFRASNYYRSAMFSVPFGDPRQNTYLTAARDCCREGGKLSTPHIEVLEIPFGNARLPGYFVSAGKPKSPTLLIVNGGDSANEEMVHWLGFACTERGWNCAVFEGPGQWSALQMNPGLTMKPDFEVPIKAVIDFMFQREDVDPDRLALYGPSLGSLLVTRVVAHEKRVRACCADGLVVDVYEAWQAVLPKVVQMAPDAVFNTMFSALEKLSPQARDTANHLRAVIGNVKTPHELMDAWKPFNVSQLAPKIDCPMLVLYGEAEVAQTNAKVFLSALKFIRQLKCPVSVRMFDYNDGWAATHCHVGGLAALHNVLFDWLDKAVHHPERLPRYDVEEKVFDVLAQYVRSQEARRELNQLRDPV